MPRLSMLPTLLRENLISAQFPREPEPDLVMDDDGQTSAYAEAGRIDGIMSAAYLFHSARISSVISGAKTVIDLGCGPATQLAQIAELNSDIEFIGIDLSPSMLAIARNHIDQLGLENVRFIEGDITRIESFKDNSVDGVISTMALHHLPTIDLLAGCFEEVGRVLSPGGAIYLTDFGRLKSLKSVLFFAYMNRKHQPHIFSLDYERSLRAAFQKQDFSTLAGQFLPNTTSTLNTFGIPILTLTKTPDRPLAESIQQKVQSIRTQLPANYRRELDDIRMLFWLSGLKNDPFR